MNEQNKPILQVKISAKGINGINNQRAIKNVFDRMCHIFKDNYKVVATPDTCDVLATNTTVVQLTIDPSTNLEDLFNQLVKISEEDDYTLSKNQSDPVYHGFKHINSYAEILAEELGNHDDKKGDNSKDATSKFDG